MPHFGLMEERKMGPVAGPFQRSRLHLRSARRRFRQGTISAGIVTLYDALSAAMEAFAADPARRDRLEILPGEDLSAERTLYRVLVRSGVVDDGFDFDAFDQLMEQALHQELQGYDYQPLLRGVEVVLGRLSVLPFDESSLPAEKPETF